jgi:threonine/homoserine/homoserine lactone efflux protein
VTVSLVSLVALLAATLMLAAIPGISVATVVAQAAIGGWRAAVACTTGIMLGDVLYLGVALFGLTKITGGSWGWLFALGSGLYLVRAGLAMMRARSAVPEYVVGQPRFVRSFIAGLGITLADQKAVLFYLAFIPGFIQMKQVTTTDLVAIMGTVLFGVGLPKLVYAAFAVGLAQRPSLHAASLKTAAAALLIAVGVALAIRGLLIAAGISLV